MFVVIFKCAPYIRYSVQVSTAKPFWIKIFRHFTENKDYNKKFANYSIVQGAHIEQSKNMLLLISWYYSTLTSFLKTQKFVDHHYVIAV